MDAGPWIILAVAAVIVVRILLGPREARPEPVFQPLHEDPDLGELSYEPRERCLMAQPRMGDGRVALLLLDTPPPPTGLELAREVRARLNGLVRDAQSAAVHDLLALANGKWRPKGAAERDGAAFAALHLEGVIATPDRAVSLVFYDDGSLFRGRRVRVVGRLDREAFSARLVG